MLHLWQHPLLGREQKAKKDFIQNSQTSKKLKKIFIQKEPEKPNHGMEKNVENVSRRLTSDDQYYESAISAALPT